MGSLTRAQEIVETLTNVGIRATTDPQMANPPCVLVSPPNLEMDTNCGYTASWQVIALVPAANTADRNSWRELDTLVDGLVKAFEVERATLIAYILNGKSYPAYLLEWNEAL